MSYIPYSNIGLASQIIGSEFHTLMEEIVNCNEAQHTFLLNVCSQPNLDLNTLRYVEVLTVVCSIFNNNELTVPMLECFLQVSYSFDDE